MKGFWKKFLRFSKKDQQPSSYLEDQSAASRSAMCHSRSSAKSPSASVELPLLNGNLLRGLPSSGLCHGATATPTTEPQLPDSFFCCDEHMPTSEELERLRRQRQDSAGPMRQSTPETASRTVYRGQRTKVGRRWQEKPVYSRCLSEGTISDDEDDVPLINYVPPAAKLKLSRSRNRLLVLPKSVNSPLNAYRPGDPIMRKRAKSRLSQPPMCITPQSVEGSANGSLRNTERLRAAIDDES